MGWVIWRTQRTLCAVILQKNIRLPKKIKEIFRIHIDYNTEHTSFPNNKFSFEPYI